MEWDFFDKIKALRNIEKAVKQKIVEESDSSLSRGLVDRSPVEVLEEVLGMPIAI